MFKIKIESRGLLNRDLEDSSFSEAIQSIYDFNDNVIIVWNGEEIPISKKMDISDSWNDILNMIANLKKGIPNFKFEWPSQTFFAIWEIYSINDVDLKIKPIWSQKINSILCIKRETFIKEWEKVIRIIKQDLEKQGYKLEELH